jgi:hypothetical protein
MRLLLIALTWFLVAGCTVPANAPPQNAQSGPVDRQPGGAGGGGPGGM